METRVFSWDSKLHKCSLFDTVTGVRADYSDSGSLMGGEYFRNEYFRNICQLARRGSLNLGAFSSFVLDAGVGLDNVLGIVSLD